MRRSGTNTFGRAPKNDGLQRKLDDMAQQLDELRSRPPPPSHAYQQPPPQQQYVGYRQLHREQQMGNDSKYCTPCGWCCGPGFLFRNSGKCLSGLCCLCEVGVIVGVWAIVIIAFALLIYYR